MGGYFKSSNLGEIRMGIPVQAVGEKVLNTVAAILARR
jgi:hypothetical protein